MVDAFPQLVLHAKKLHTRQEHVATRKQFLPTTDLPTNIYSRRQLPFTNYPLQRSVAQLVWWRGQVLTHLLKQNATGISKQPGVHPRTELRQKFTPHPPILPCWSTRVYGGSYLLLLLADVGSGLKSKKDKSSTCSCRSFRTEIPVEVYSVGRAGTTSFRRRLRLSNRSKNKTSY